MRESFNADFRNGPERTVQRTVVTEFEGHDVEFELRGATVDGAEADAEVRRRATTTEVTLRRPDGEPFADTRRVELQYELHHLVTDATDEATDRTVDRFSWPLFAPTWPQATKGLDVTLTLSHEVDDALIREPQAYVGWLLASGTAWLEPEGETAEGVQYSFSNDDTLPPNADIWLDADFEAGTFVQPEKTPLFWVQTYGPLVPMALLAVLLLFSLAARRVVWADSAGRPWYKAESVPPNGIEVGVAAELMRKPRHAELVDALAGGSATPRRLKRGRRAEEARRSTWLLRIAHAGERAGRWGSVLSVLRWRASWRGDKRVLEMGLRWKPDNYLRDIFIYFPLAITLLQWGLLRQLSHQRILLVVWMPFLFVVVSTVIAALTIWAVWRPRPLTHDGAKLMQYLKGINVYARATRLAERGPLDESVLPYALLFEPPRTAGEITVAHAVAVSGDRDIAKGWRTENFISAGAFAAMFAAVALLGISIVTISTQPRPYDMWPDRITEHSELPGTLGQEMQGFDISAELERGPSGAAQLRVVEKITVRFAGEESTRVPQFAREWPTERLGQQLGMHIDSVTIDGEAIPYREIEQPTSTVMMTQFERVMKGSETFEIEYTLDSAAVQAEVDGDLVEQVRWTALYDFWEDTYYAQAYDFYGAKEMVRPLRVRISVAPVLVGHLISGGWIDNDHDQPKIAGERGNTAGPWVTELSFYGEREGIGAARDRHELLIGEKETQADGTFVATLDADRVRSRITTVEPGEETGDVPETEFAIDPDTNQLLDKYGLDLTMDLGAFLNFEPGTFEGIGSGAYQRYMTSYRLPYIALLSLAGGIVAASIISIVLSRRARAEGRRAGSSWAAVSYTAIPIAGVAQCVLFFWAATRLSGDDPRLIGAVVAGGAMFVTGIVQVLTVARTRAPLPQKSRGATRGDTQHVARKR